jgi:hypothetical protein
MPSRYKLSFTALSLGLSESIQITQVYLECGDWAATKAMVKDKNLLQSRTQKRTQRVYQEIEPRLQTLSEGQLRFLVEEANVTEQKHLLWYAVCKRYEFIRDFAVEVLHQRYLMMNDRVDEYDYTVFYNSKAEWHTELRTLKDTTQVKIRTVLFRMLREADFLSEDNLIKPCLLSQAVHNQIQLNGTWSSKIYPARPAMNMGEENAA